MSLSAIHKRMAQDVPLGRLDESTARRLWWAALETLQNEIFAPLNFSQGFWLASPLPALYDSKLLKKLQGCVWTPEELDPLHIPFSSIKLPPSYPINEEQLKPSSFDNYIRMPLRENDGYDPLLIVITPGLQVAIALHGNQDQRNLLMRSDHETFSDLLELINLRLASEEQSQSNLLREKLANIGELTSDNQLDKVFWPLLAEKLALIAPSITFQSVSDNKKTDKFNIDASRELHLLEALTHEVRTPLSTIRTLIRSLLRQKNLSDLVINRLKQIDSECTEQIDRFGLIFDAAEMQRNEPVEPLLASTDLGQILQMLDPTWTRQLERRGISLSMDIGPDLPYVLSDPARLELMLGGLIDRNTRDLKPGTSVFLELRPAGHRLKLQIFFKGITAKDFAKSGLEAHSDLGSVLSWNPNTGSLQLSQAATQRLLASLGGRLTRRRNSGFTVFFPIAEVQS